MPGREIESPQLSAALELIRQFDLSPMAGLRIWAGLCIPSRDSGGGDRRGGRMTLALWTGSATGRWRQIQFGPPTSTRHLTADLSIKNNLPVKWARPAARAE